MYLTNNDYMVCDPPAMGIAALPGFKYDDHSVEVYVAVLYRNAERIIASEVMPTMPNRVEWAGSTEATVEALANYFMGPNTIKGVLVLAIDRMWNVNYATVKGEALEDDDVKFEMYGLIGFGHGVPR